MTLTFCNFTLLLFQPLHDDRCVHQCVSSKVRLDIRVIIDCVRPQDLMWISLFQVTPSDRTQQDTKARDLETSFSAEGAWTAGSEFAQTPDEGLNKLEDFNRIGSNKSLSKSKRVKSFIQKKCKDFSNSFSGSHGEGGSESTATVLPRSKSTSRASSEVSTTSWYVANDYHSDEEVFNHVTVVKVGVEVRDSLNVTTVTVAEPELVKVTEPDSAKTDCDNVDSRNEGGTVVDEPLRKLSDSDSDEDHYFLAPDVPQDQQQIVNSEEAQVNLEDTGQREIDHVDEAQLMPLSEVSKIFCIMFTSSK